MMGQMPRWKIVTIAGHPLYVEPLFLLLIAFFAFSGVTSLAGLLTGLLWAPVLFVSIVWHELGHAFAIDKFGYGKSTIILQGLGGVTVNARGNTPPGKGAAISFAGPAFSFSLVAIFAPLYFLYPGIEALSVAGGPDLLQQFFFLMMAANVFWGAFNLLPIVPLDGGHIVRHGLRAKLPERKAYLYAAYGSLAMLVLVAIPAMMWLHPMFTVLLGILFAMHNWQTIKQIQGGAMIR